MYLCENENIGLMQYTHADDQDMYLCWLNEETQRGFNHKFQMSFTEFTQCDITRFPFWAVIVHKQTQQKIGTLRLGISSGDTDLAIWIYPQYRAQGFGTQAFQLALTYVFSNYKYNAIYAGCYQDNVKSRKMLERIGFSRLFAEDIVEENCFSGEKTVQQVFIMTRDMWEKYQQV